MLCFSSIAQLNWLSLLTAWLVVWCGESPAEDHGSSVDFNRDVRPILAEHCLRCHGFDEKSRQAELRLDDRKSALRARAIVANHPERSELIRRVTAIEVEERMPPPETGKTLSAAQIGTLHRWIAEGARYERHWSFEPPSRRPPPSVSRRDWPINEIDYFVLARLERESMAPAADAPEATLLRRASFALTGLPPTTEDLDSFLKDEHPAAFEQVVERLLASPRLGERMAVDWLDAARYADTNGYFSDKTRQMWPWRDWVIRSFNQNQPFDQFTIEQLAGDLLPIPTMEQLIATGFHRNSMANNETGIIDEEYRVEYVVDRVGTTASTWMGITLECAQCHDHKYDPITQKEFYQLFAFFNNIEETGLATADDPPPLISVPTAEQRLRSDQAAIDLRTAEREFESPRATLQAALNAWEHAFPREPPAFLRDNPVLHAAFNDPMSDPLQRLGTQFAFERGILGTAAKFDGSRHAELATTWNVDRPWTLGLWLKPEGSLGCPLSRIESSGNRRGVELLWRKGRFVLNLVHQWGVNAIEVATISPISSKEWHHVVVSSDGSRSASGIHVFIDGVEASLKTFRDSLSGTMQNSEPIRIGRRDEGLGYHGLLDEVRVLPVAIAASEVGEWFRAERICGIIETAPARRGVAENELLLEQFLATGAAPSVREAWNRLKAARDAEQAVRAEIPTTLIMREMAKPRVTRILARGQYDKPGEAVEPGVPAALAPWPPDAPLNRLGFARWLVSPRNPLTARVFVNRLWQQCFGAGLVHTPSDLGSRGDIPTHPELLEWLAVRFINSGWNVKEILRLIVTSRTYRQSSVASRELMDRDPENRLLARGPRFRLSAEMLRDQALAISGLLVPKIGGPSVKPYQPDGLWETVSYNGEDSYVADLGDGLWRRSLYTFIKRQAPPPALLTFDGPTREKCTLHRARTNTPLQALVLLNDETYVESARVLACRIARSQANGDDSRLSLMIRSVLARDATTAELAALRELLNRQRDRFQRGALADKLLSVGKSELSTDLDRRELAAWTVVAHTLLNLDETVTLR